MGCDDWAADQWDPRGPTLNVDITDAILLLHAYIFGGTLETRRP